MFFYQNSSLKSSCVGCVTVNRRRMGKVDYHSNAKRIGHPRTCTRRSRHDKVTENSNDIQPNNRKNYKITWRNIIINEWLKHERTVRVLILVRENCRGSALSFAFDCNRRRLINMKCNYGRTLRARRFVSHCRLCAAKSILLSTKHCL